MEMNSRTKELIRTSLSIGALKLNPAQPFLWASGYRMPVYNDNRLFLRKKEYRMMIAESFREIISSGNIQVDVIAGTSTAGIPHATTLADLMDKPLTYVRDKPKAHGLNNRIEGLPAEKGYEGRKVLLIEDLISTGGSSIEAVKAVREAGGKIDYCLSIFSYGLKEADENFQGLKPVCTPQSIITYSELIGEAEEIGYIRPEEIGTLNEWREDPFNWGELHGFPGKGKKG
jgi:orotate phosphoribosyltransferase